MQQGKHRLAQFKCCKKIQFSNYARQHPRYKTDANISRHLVHGVSESSSLHISSPYYDPSRHYEEILPGMAPSHFSMPQLTAWYENRFSAPQVEQVHEQDADGTLPSDKEVVSGWVDSHADVSSTADRKSEFHMQREGPRISTTRRGFFLDFSWKNKWPSVCYGRNEEIKLQSE
jgi:hypothetical protein